MSGGVFWHVPGEVPAVLELAALLPSASVSLRVSFWPLKLLTANMWLSLYFS